METAHGETDAVRAATRRGVARCRAALDGGVEPSPVVLGFDGFVDTTCRIVASRSGPDECVRMTEMRELAERIEDSVEMDSSCTIEWERRDAGAGGHTSHVGNALATLGSDPTLVGTFGDPIAEAFTSQFDRDRLVSVGEPTQTTAVEFDDGKIILVAPETQISLDWEALCERVALETLAEYIDGTRLLGCGCWGKMPGMPSIWDGLRTELWPTLDDPPTDVLIDTGDVRQLDASAFDAGAASIRALDDVVPVTVSANRAETLSLAEQFGQSSEFDSLADATAVVRDDGLATSRVVSHAATRAVVGTESGTTEVVTAYTDSPSVLLSSGDHFNAGLALATMLGLRGSAAIVLGSAVAGFFVRNGRPPTQDELRAFLDDYEASLRGPVE